VTVVVLGPKGHFEVDGLCNQIGEGGLGAIIASELPVAEVVNLQFSIPSQPDSISVRAVVRWRDRLQHGFEFFGIPSELRARIRAYCKDLTEQEGP
jgi:PilZ domain